MRVWKSRSLLDSADLLAWQRGKLDSLCLDCGAGSAASSWCYRCKGRELRYVQHLTWKAPPGWKPGDAKPENAPDPGRSLYASSSCFAVKGPPPEQVAEARMADPVRVASGPDA